MILMKKIKNMCGFGDKIGVNAKKMEKLTFILGISTFSLR